MLNILRVDFRRYTMTKIFLIFAAAVAVILPVFMSIFVNVLGAKVYGNPLMDFSNISYYSSDASIYLAIIITVFLNAEAGEGIIRNKLISGKKRYQVLLSYVLVNASVACLLQILSVASVAAVGVIMGATWMITFEEVVHYVIVAALAGVAISVLYTAIYICFCTKKMANVIPIAISLLAKISMVVISDALFTSSGIPKVTGATLQIYSGIDRYLAFFHLNGELRYDNMSYLIGNVALIIISILIGSLVFTKKDFQ